MYVLKLESRGVACEVSVNDVPLASVTGSAASNRLAFAAPWITEPTGIMSARILPPPIPPERPVELSTAEQKSAIRRRKTRPSCYMPGGVA